jgi:large subunit ribosomal protein L5
MQKFKELYKAEVTKKLNYKFKYKNSMLVPKILKITLNMGVGDAAKDSKVVNNAVSDMALIAGQKPVITKVRKSNASFKIREGMKIGCKVTLRKNKMYEFLERLVLIALPRSREFKGFSLRNMDGQGNLSFGIKEQISFAEIDYDKVDTIRGMDISIVTSAKTDEEAKELLSGFYLPFNDNVKS